MRGTGDEPVGAPQTPRRASKVFRVDPARLIVLASLLAIAWYLLTHGMAVRTIEAGTSRPLVGLVTGRAVHLPNSDRVFYPDHGRPGWRALQVTFLCSSALLAVPVLAIGALAAMLRRSSAVRALIGSLAAAALLFLVNIARIAMVAGATHRWGQEGFTITHRLIGSTLVVAAMAASFGVLFRSLGGRRVPSAPG